MCSSRSKPINTRLRRGRCRVLQAVATSSSIDVPDALSSAPRKMAPFARPDGRSADDDEFVAKFLVTARQPGTDILAVKRLCSVFTIGPGIGLVNCRQTGAAGRSRGSDGRDTSPREPLAAAAFKLIAGQQLDVRPYVAWGDVRVEHWELVVDECLRGRFRQRWRFLSPQARTDCRENEDTAQR